MEWLTKKYKKRKAGTRNFGHFYEPSVAAIWAMRLLTDLAVDDFTMFTNVEGFGALDDVVIYVKYNNGSHKMYLIQAKHTENQALTVNVLLNTGKDNKFNLRKFQTCYENFKYDDETLDVWYVLHTNRPFKYSNVEGKDISFEDDDYSEHLLLNNNKSLKRFPKIKSESPDFDQEFLDRFLLFANQVSQDRIKSLIADLLNLKVGSIDDNMVGALIDRFNCWSVDKSSGWLYKSDFEMILLETVLSPLIIHPRDVDIPPEQCSLWNDVIANYDVTVLPNDNDVAATITKAITWKIKESEAWKLNSIESISNNDKYRKLISKRKCKRPVELKDLYYILWQLSEIPLLLHCYDNETFCRVQNLLCICKGTIRKFVIFNGNNITNKNLDGYYRVFNSLKDVPEEKLGNILNRLSVCVQGRNIYLQVTPSDQEIIKLITPRVLFLISFEKLIVGEKITTKEYLIERYFKKTFVHINLLNEENNIFVIVGTKFNYKMHQQLTQFVLTARVTILYDTEMNMDTIERVVKEFNTATPIHFLTPSSIIKYGSLLEWRFSTANVSVVTKYLFDSGYAFLTHRNELCIEADKALDYFMSPVTIFSGMAGIGKSVATRYLASCYLKKWSVIIDINKHLKHIEQSLQQNKDILEILEPFLGFQNMGNDVKAFLKAVFAQKLKNKQVLLVVDEYDEANASKVDVFLNMLYDSKNKLWVTTNSFNKKQLEKRFQSVAVEITGFNNEDQKQFLRDKLSKTGKNYNTDDLNNAFSVIKNSFFYADEILRFPFLINLVSEVILVEGLEYFSNKNVNICSLYEKMVSSKIKSKSKIITLQKMALAMIFPEAHLRKFIKWEEFKSCEEELVADFLSNKSFLISGVDDEGKAQFVHSSYVEYLAAAYLVNNIDYELENEGFLAILKEMVDLEKLSLKSFFDVLLVQGLSLHEAILYDDLEKVITLLNSDDLEHLLAVPDKCGRTALHLAAAYGSLFVHGWDSEDDEVLEGNMLIHASVLFPPISKNGDDIFKCILEKLFTVSNDTGFLTRRDKLGYNVFDYTCTTGHLVNLDKLFNKHYNLFGIDHINNAFLYHCISNNFNNLKKVKFDCLCRLYCNLENVLNLAVRYCFIDEDEKVRVAEETYCKNIPQ